MYHIPNNSFVGSKFISETTTKTLTAAKESLDTIIDKMENDPTIDLIVVSYQSEPPGTDYRCAKPEDAWTLRCVTLPKFGKNAISNKEELVRYHNIEEILIDQSPLSESVPENSCAIPIFNKTEDVASLFTPKPTLRYRYLSFKLSVFNWALDVLNRITSVFSAGVKKINTDLELASRGHVHKLIGDIHKSTRMAGAHPTQLY